uniref:Uncharacterized protein n=1 Tax=Panagrolaimus sp. ES5 TaxID=591445 RepID=A0AC34FR12_9BILA
MVKLTPSLVYIRTKTSVENVTKLNLWGCDVDDIELCSQMPKLQILSLSVNRVSSLAPLRYCIALEELYIRKNKLEELDELKNLSGLKKLRVLWIEENPCTENSSYRNKVIQMLPQLMTLDNIALKKGIVSHDVEDPIQRRTIADKVIPMSASVHYSNQLGNGTQESETTEDDLQAAYPQMSQSMMILPLNLNRTTSLMNTSMIAGLNFDERNEDMSGWEDDFNLEESAQPSNTMFQSFHEGIQPMPKGYASQIWGTAPIRTLTRHRISPRSQSASPARTQRVENIVSAVRVLLDELDQDGLRHVIDEAQRRIKKKH